MKRLCLALIGIANVCLAVESAQGAAIAYLTPQAGVPFAQKPINSTTMLEYR